MTLWGVCCFRAARVGNHLIIYMALVYRFADRNWLWKYGSITARNTGYEWLCITAWKNTREMELSFQATFHFNNTIPRSLMAENNLWINSIDVAMDCGFREHSSLHPDFVLDFLHDGMAFCFLFFLFHYLACPFRIESRLGGWTSFFLSTSHRLRRTSTFDDALASNDCIMEWVNIPSNGTGGWNHQMQSRGQMGRGQKIPFLFLSEFMVQRNRCHPWLLKRIGWFWDQQKDFPYEIETQKLTLPSLRWVFDL